MTAEAVRRLIRGIADQLAARGGEGVDEFLKRLAAQDLGDDAFHLPEPGLKPVCRMLPETLMALRAMDSAVAEGIAAIAPLLQWDVNSNYTDELLGTGFLDNYGWTQLVGRKGFFPGDDFYLGLLLLGPQRHYLDHYHLAPELYWPLTAGSFWKKGNDGFVERQQGEVIWHPSMVVHAMITKEKPLLAVYAWTKDTHSPARLSVLDRQAAS